jgi:hypothetical protein
MALFGLNFGVRMATTSYTACRCADDIAIAILVRENKELI